MPEIEIECVEDLYALYVFVFEIPAFDFWHLPLAAVQQIVEDRAAIDAWRTSEEERRAKRSGN